MAGQNSKGPLGRGVALATVGLGLMAMGFVMGRLSAPAPPHREAGTSPALHALPVQAPGDPREMIPLTPGPKPPPGPGDCPVLIYQDGQLYSLPRPGLPGGDPELIPLQPGPPAPPQQPQNPSI